MQRKISLVFVTESLNSKTMSLTAGANLNAWKIVPELEHPVVIISAFVGLEDAEVTD